MSISKLALVVFALLAGTGLSVRAFLESRRPLALPPLVTVRAFPQDSSAARPEPLDATSGACAEDVEPERTLDDPASVRPSAAAPECTPALVVEAAAAEPGALSRWITVRRDGAGRGSDRVAKARARGASGCTESGPAATSAPTAPSAAAGSPPTQVRPD